MKEQITINSVLTYTDQKTGEIKTRLGFMFNDKKYRVFNKKFKGSSKISCFYDSDKVFGMITEEMIGKPIEAVLTQKSSVYNPMKSTTYIDKLVYAGSVYNLL